MRIKQGCRRSRSINSRNRRNVVPWTKIRRAIKQRERERRAISGSRQAGPGGLSRVLMFADGVRGRPFQRQHPDGALVSSSAEGSAHRALDPPGSHAPAECRSLPDLESSGPSASSAIHAPHPRPWLSHQAIGCSDQEERMSGPEAKVPCPIMGNILLCRQRVELYPPETHYPGEPLAFSGMAVMPNNQEHGAIRALRDNTKALKAASQLSYRDIAKAAGMDEVVGRTINGLVKGASKTRVDRVAAAADGLGVEMWQLFVPHVSHLEAAQREQLRQLVETFVEGGNGARDMLASVLKVLADRVSDSKQDAPRAQRVKGR